MISLCLIEEFKGYFDRFGRVLSAEVMFNRETQKSRGFGFIIFDGEDAVDRVLQVPEHTIDGKLVRSTGFCRLFPARTDSCTALVGCC